MSPFSFPVIAGTAVVGSPAIYAALATGTLSPDVALARVMLCAVGVWALCSLLASLVSNAVASNQAVARDELADPAADAAPMPGQSGG